MYVDGFIVMIAVLFLVIVFLMILYGIGSALHAIAHEIKRAVDFEYQPYGSRLQGLQ